MAQSLAGCFPLTGAMAGYISRKSLIERHSQCVHWRYPFHQHGWGLICPPRLRSVASLLGPARQSPCVLMLATVYPYLGKKYKHPRTVGVKGEREGSGGKVLGQKSFCRNFGNGGVGPPLFPSIPALPPSLYPPGGFTWNMLRVDTVRQWLSALLH